VQTLADIARDVIQCTLNLIILSQMAPDDMASSVRPALTDGVTFSDVISVFYPCFTGILVGRCSLTVSKPMLKLESVCGCIA